MDKVIIVLGNGGAGQSALCDVAIVPTLVEQLNEKGIEILAQHEEGTEGYKKALKKALNKAKPFALDYDYESRKDWFESMSLDIEKINKEMDRLFPKNYHIKPQKRTNRRSRFSHRKGSYKRFGMLNLKKDKNYGKFKHENFT